ncbi:hypothetical protein EI555_019400 [Monodon monoceros]|uniref:Amiloride-sensitive sodium channel subunit alpha n=1 Tax=Monodon monoceros TaxID=40151 RepID=A0A4U1F286_MONMO|nr:hypothetical protein EI555_019400 [Monodon monoceros]
MFNSGEDGKPLLTTVKGGTGNGLEIMLDIQQDEYLPIWGETEETTFEAGVKVQIHSQSEPPFIQELGFGVAPGFQTFVATQEQRIYPVLTKKPFYYQSAAIGNEKGSDCATWTFQPTNHTLRQFAENSLPAPTALAQEIVSGRRCDDNEPVETNMEDPLLLLDWLTYLPPPWGECRSSEMGLDFFPVYSITACRIDCETRYIVENCNCRMVHMPGDAPFCTPEQHKECAEPALGLLAEKDSNYCLCRTPCNLTRYNKELSMVKIPSKTSAKYLEKKFNKSEKYISYVKWTWWMEALNYETIEQKKAYEVAALLGDIGGQMGLFIGASILTILELFDYIYEVRFGIARGGMTWRPHPALTSRTKSWMGGEHGLSSPRAASPSLSMDIVYHHLLGTGGGMDLIKDKLLDLLGKEEEERSHDENVSTCDPMPNHSENISHSVNVPLQTALGTLEEIAC